MAYLRLYFGMNGMICSDSHIVLSRLYALYSRICLMCGPSDELIIKCKDMQLYLQ